LTETNSQREARADLAASLRFAAAEGLNEGICNHFSLMVPGRDDRFLINPQGFHWGELTADDLAVMAIDGTLIAGRHPVEPTAAFIHAAVHRAKPAARCVMHTHMPYATAICCRDRGRLMMCNQNALRFFDRIAYDDDYAGLALDGAEGDRIAGSLGDREILFLRSHGVIVTGASAAWALDDLYYLERSAMVQVLAEAGGARLSHVDDRIAALAASQIAGERQQSDYLLAAFKRRLARTDPTALG
jgi:ribulose-5-phosphate 4-epimerase/fuculose-1-phosphate aldolase